MRVIPFSPPDITQAEIDEVVDTLKSGWITTGPKTKQFEKEIAAYCNTSKAVALNSWTACMELTLRLLGIGPGDEVVTTAYTYTATASVIHHVGAKIIMVDTGKDSFHIDYDSIDSAITEKTKAIIPVDIAGVMCDYDRIFDIVERKRSMFQPKNDVQSAIGRVAILADAAHSFGATYKGRKSGSVADFTSFSFHAVKNLTTGEGGAVTWRDIPGVDNEEIYKNYMLFSLHGQSKDALAKSEPGAWAYDIISPYYKFNMTDISASIGLVQLKRYKTLLNRRSELISHYNKQFQELNVTPISHYSLDCFSSGHLYILRLNGADEKVRDRVIQQLAAAGISSNVHYKPLPLLSAYKNMGFLIKDFPNAYAIYENGISLPMHTLLKEDDIDYILAKMKSIWF